MNPTQQYREWYEAEPAAFPLFHQPWWLDIVCGGAAHWEVIRAEHQRTGRAVYLPITWQRRWGLRVITKPPLTPYLGPLFTDPADQNNLTLLEGLARQMPRTFYTKMTFRPEASMALPFHWAGFRLGMRYTYRLEVPEDRRVLYTDFRRDVKRNIKRAGERLVVRTTDEFAAFYALFRKTFDRKEMSTPVDAGLLEALTKAAATRNQAILWSAIDANAQAYGALLCCHDHERTYLLASGLSEAGRQLGAFQFLVWSVLRQLPPGQREFDFCGSMLPEVARVNGAFGAQPWTYPQIEKSGLVFPRR